MKKERLQQTMQKYEYYKRLLLATIWQKWIISVQWLSRVQLFATPWTAACQASLSITNSWSLPNSCPLSQWCHPIILSSVVPFSSHPQSFPASGSFPMSQLFASGGQNIGVSASTSVLSMNTQDWSPLGPYHFCPSLSPSSHESFSWYLWFSWRDR